VWNPGAVLEVTVFVRSAAPEPGLGTASEVAQAVRRQPNQKLAPDLALSEGLGLRVRLQSTTFQQGDAKSLIRELPGESDAGSAGADDTHIGVD
jgi:hypothetical protein